MRLEHADRFARLDQQRLVLIEFTQRLQDGFEAIPVARRLADAAVDDQCVRVLSNLRVQVVLHHTVRRFDQPVLAGEAGATRRADSARQGVNRGMVGVRHDGAPL